jgi:hypothetical protein
MLGGLMRSLVRRLMSLEAEKLKLGMIETAALAPQTLRVGSITIFS